MKKILIIAAGLALSAAVNAADPAAGKEKSKVCAACHGEGGAAPIADNPKLAGQYYDYLLRALADYKSGARKNPVMSGMVANLKKDDMADLAAYFASQQALSTKY
ncbi:MAG: cytochrome c [Burkholderiales bacterium]